MNAKRGLQGRFETISTTEEIARAFVPAPLPPNPPIEWTAELREKFNRAHVALGRLDSVSILLPDISLVLYSYVRKEAVLSSMIEGTQSSLSDLLVFELEENPGAPLNDVREVSNYVAALDHGLKRLREGFPLSLRLLREIHEVLLSKGRGAKQTPGEFRKSQNWIGGSRPGNAAFVPPPAHHLADCMGKLELFLHDSPEQTPVLLKAALAHLQFETIHPFLDGNGRLGRLLITLLLCEQGVLKEPMLYLSLYFKTHRRRYYELLQNTRLTGDWESWLEFFADAVEETATQAFHTVQQLMELADNDAARIEAPGRVPASVHKVHRAMLERPIVSAKWLRGKTQLSLATVHSCLKRLESAGVVRESTGGKRKRLYVYSEYLDIVSQGMELPE